MDKQFEIDKLRRLQREITQTVNGWPIYQSQISASITGIGFWCDEAIAALESTSLQSEIPILSVDEAAARQIKRQQKEDLMKLEEQLQ